MNGFVRHTRSGLLVANFSGFEADLLRSLAGQIIELLHNELAAPLSPVDPLEAMLDFSGPVDEPEDPVLLRLLPNAHADDPEASGEFRRYTESALRDSKSATAAVVIDSLEEGGLGDEVDDDVMIDVELTEPEAIAWLRAFTDIRLALATRLGIADDDETGREALADDDPRAQAHDIYEWVGWLQETLVEALSED